MRQATRQVGDGLANGRLGLRNVQVRVDVQDEVLAFRLNYYRRAAIRGPFRGFLFGRHVSPRVR